jgi:hypothetical protein
MYFYLKNVPMFKGSYWITDVTHKIQNNNIVTTFVGTRIPSSSLPDPKDSLMSSYKPLFDTILQRAAARVRVQDTNNLTKKWTFTVNGQTKMVDLGAKRLEDHRLIVRESNYTEFGVPYNGYVNPGGKSEEYIQKISVSGSGIGTGEWLRANVVMFEGENYQLNDDTQMTLFSYRTPKSNVTWKDIKTENNKSKFYSTRFLLHTIDNNISNAIDKLFGATTTFYNPETKTQVVLKHSYDVNNKVFNGPINVGPKISEYGIAMSKKYYICKCHRCGKPFFDSYDYLNDYNKRIFCNSCIDDF